MCGPTNRGWLPESQTEVTIVKNANSTVSSAVQSSLKKPSFISTLTPKQRKELEAMIQAGKVDPKSTNSNSPVVKKPVKAKTFLVKAYNPKTQAHEQLEIPVGKLDDMSFAEVIEYVREEGGFEVSGWSFKIRIPVGI